MGYNVILADIDNTLLDFTAGSHAALRDLLAELGVPFTRERLQTYLDINNGLWEAFERGEIEKSAIYPTRFERFLDYLQLPGDPVAVNGRYMEGLRANIFFMPHCMEFLNAVKGRYRLFAVTNGDTLTQVVRLRNSGLDAYFEDVFISEQMGTKKPEKAYFDRVFEAIGPVDKRRVLLLGDSLTSDMQGGRNAGVDTCLLGTVGSDPRCDYIVEDLMDVLPILEGKGHERNQ